MRRRLPVLLVLTSLTAAACEVAGVGTPPSYKIQADFPTTIGLYPGSFVRQLGINVGSVTNVVDVGDHVVVTMKIRNTDKLAGNADAILVGDSVLGERYIQFTPAYTGGTPMAAGTVLPESRVTVPVEIDTVLRSLDTVLNGINPTNVKQFTENLAAVLNNQGTTLNQLIHNAAGTLTVLGNKSQELGQLTTTLANLSGQLGTRDQELATLITDYDLLSQTLAGDHSQIDGVITQLTNVTTQATALLAPNLQPIQTDVADLTTVGQTLDRNISALDIGLQYAPRLFQAAQNAYDPEHNWLPLNSQLPAGLTGAVLSGQVRDALASVCRRVAAKTPAVAAALAACGNPDSGFFDPILNLVPTVLGAIPGQGTQTPPKPPAASAAPADASAAFTDGLAAIPGLSAADRQLLTGVPLHTDAAPAAAAPPGSAAVAALAASPRLGAVPTVVVPVTHHSLVHRFLHWIGGLL